MCLCFVDAALENNTYKFAGQLFAYSIVHRGTLPTFFSDLLYTAISEGCWCASPELSDVSDESIRRHLQTVSIVHLEPHCTFHCKSDVKLTKVSWPRCWPTVTKFSALGRKTFPLHEFVF